MNIKEYLKLNGFVYGESAGIFILMCIDSYLDEYELTQEDIAYLNKIDVSVENTELGIEIKGGI